MKSTILHLFIIAMVISLSGCQTFRHAPVAKCGAYFVEGGSIRPVTKEKTYTLIVFDVPEELKHLPYISYFKPVKECLATMGYKEVEKLSDANYYINVFFDSKGPTKDTANGRTFDFYDFEVGMMAFDLDIYFRKGPSGRQESSTTESAQLASVWYTRLKARTSYYHPPTVIPDLLQVGSPYVLIYNGPFKKISEFKE